MNYTTFVTTARSHLKASDRAYVRLMCLLCEVHDTPRIWKSRHATFKDVLRAERLCTVNRFEAFRKARALNLDVNKLGVEAACLLARYPPNLREHATRSTRAWIARHKVRPTYQLVAEYVKGLAPPREGRTTKAELRRYIKVLQKICRKHGLSYPKEPK